MRGLDAEVLVVGGGPVGLFLALFAAWCSIATFDSRGTHAMTVAEALRAMDTPLTDNERKLAVAALRRQALDAVQKLVAESTRNTAAGREAAAAIAHLHKELRR